MNPKNHLPITVGSKLNERYLVEAIVGHGSFASVTRCLDTKRRQTVAVKINNNDSESAKQAKAEMTILQKLRSLHVSTCYIVEYMDVFSHMDNTCITLELLDQSLHAYMDDRGHNALLLMEVTPIVHQLAEALCHLKFMGIVHADVKPENIMIVNRYEMPLTVKLIDFGLAFESAAGPSAQVQSVWYTAPEVMLGVPFNEAIDMWSLGVVAADLVIGYPMYPGKDYYQVLGFILQTLGQLPEYMLECGTLTGNYFHHKPSCLQQWWIKSEKEHEDETGIPLQDVRYLQLESIDQIEVFMQYKYGYQDGQEQFMDLLKSMLQLDPNYRIQPMGLLEHPIFQPYNKNPTEEPQTEPGHHIEGEKEVDEAHSDGTCDLTEMSVGSTLDDGFVEIDLQVDDTRMDRAVAQEEVALLLHHVEEERDVVKERCLQIFFRNVTAIFTCCFGIFRTLKSSF